MLNVISTCRDILCVDINVDKRCVNHSTSKHKSHVPPFRMETVSDCKDDNADDEFHEDFILDMILQDTVVAIKSDRDVMYDYSLLHVTPNGITESEEGTRVISGYEYQYDND